jgi:tRNA(Arg) A34 adenosine deaminase TadA
MHAEHQRFMANALEEAKRARDFGNAAVGAVIVRDGEVLSAGCNEVTSSFDITAHAESVAIRKLTISRRQLNSGSQADSGPFAGAVLYSTLEPWVLHTCNWRAAC